MSNPHPRWADEGPLLGARIDQAVSSLPPHPRGIFLAIRNEGVSYGVLATRLAMTNNEVEHAFAAALVELDRAVERHEQAYSAAMTRQQIGSLPGLSQRRPGR